MGALRAPIPPSQGDDANLTLFIERTRNLTLFIERTRNLTLFIERTRYPHPSP
jgi:hypothetical protein